MSVWRRTRNEVAGAWRSLRYDLDRRPEPGGGPAPEVTSTGMSTFGGVPAADLCPGHDAYARAPRRLAALGAFGVLAALAAAGSYFAVVGGLGAVLAEEPAAAEAYPLAIGAPTADPAAEAASTTGMGRGAALRAGGTTTVAVRPQTIAAPATEPAPARRAPRRTQPLRAGAPTTAECDCGTPPVPTPTAPPSPSPTPSAGASPSPSRSETSPSAGDSPSADPSGSGGGSVQPPRPGHRGR